MSLALARKYRPKSFATVAVQSHVAGTLKGAIARGRVAHGYLLCGPRGTGKTTLARVLAMALNCENKRDDGEPCGECPSCTRIWSGSASLDVVEIDAASNRGVDDARDLRERAQYAPTGDDRYKVYIVDEAHMLTREAWNALLKVLEEPPPRVVFVFATTEPQKIAQAAAPVLSRLQRFDLKRIGPADVRERLAAVLAEEKVEAEPEALAMLARAADGSMRDALSLTDQVLSWGGGTITPQRVRDALGLVPEDETLALFDLVLDRKAGDVFAVVGRLADHGIDFNVLLADFSDLLRAQLALALGGTPPEISDRLRQELAARAPRVNAADLVRMLVMLVELEPHFRRSAQQQLLFETLLVRFALLDRTVDLESVLRGVMGAPQGSSGGGASSRAEPSRAESARAEPSRGALGRDEPSRAAAPAVREGDSRPSAPRLRDSTAVPPVAAAPAVGRQAPRSTASAPPAADVAAPVATMPAEINRLAEFWDEVVDAVRRGGRGTLASMLDHATPQAVSGNGTVTLAVDTDVHGDAITQAAEHVLAALRTRFTGVERIVVKAQLAAPMERLTEESVLQRRVAQLRKRDPVLDAAIDALDLRLLP
ncbi:MAG: DNA polymerase III subunit gamma/tau [Gemmatimonadaceae bacterium]|nr:DNA polymerase III subunit gamma/tau [Gemmatimonadaceae bacterium]